MAPLPKGGCQTPIPREAADWGIFTSSLFTFTSSLVHIPPPQFANWGTPL